jgi:hypothetical protein
MLTVTEEMMEFVKHELAESLRDLFAAVTVGADAAADLRREVAEWSTILAALELQPDEEALLPPRPRYL